MNFSLTFNLRNAGPGFVVAWVFIAALAIARVGLLQHTVTLAEFGDDGEYMHLAENILTGNHYGDLGLVIDPDFARPREEARSVYPVGYPAIIALLWTVFGRSLLVLKIANVIFVIAAAIPISLLLAELTQSRTLGLAISILWFICPITLESAEMIQSDLPFIAAAYWFIYLWRNFVVDWSPGYKSYAGLAALGAMLCCVIDIRSVGVALVPAIVADEAWRRRSLPALSLGASLIAVGLLTLQALVIVRPGPGYLAAFQGMGAIDFVRAILSNLQNDRWQLSLALDPGFAHAMIGTVLCLVVVVLAVIGLISGLRRRPGPILFFFLTYFTLITIFPDDAAWARYMLPILPVLFALAVTGIVRLLEFKPRLAHAGSWALIGSLGATFASAAILSPLLGAVPIWFPAPSTDAMLQAVRQTTSKTSIVAFFYPYLITTQAGRPTLRIWPQQVATLAPQELVCRYARMGVGYVALKWSAARPVTRFYAWDHSDAPFLKKVVAQVPQAFETKFKNADFILYSLTPSACIAHRSGPSQNRSG